jgi:hypothetical protein
MLCLLRDFVRGLAALLMCSHTKTRRHEGLKILEPRIERMTRISGDVNGDRREADRGQPVSSMLGTQKPFHPGQVPRGVFRTG